MNSFNKPKLVFSKLDNKTLFKEYKDAVFLIDANVYILYKHYFSIKKYILINCTEENKSLKTVSLFFQKLSNLEVNRNTVIVAVGGGILLDLAGFIAATYLRGLDIVYVPTTLLAQVDACLGGKNSLNLFVDGKFIKNQIGTFKNSSKIIICPEFLKTLNKKYILDGIAEIFKHSILASKLLFFKISNNISYLYDYNFIKSLIKPSLAIKQSIVDKDFYENGLRRTLNLGHTFSHALESLYKIRHGEAVLLGLKISLDLSYKLKYISKKNYLSINITLEKLLNLRLYKILNNLDKEKLFKFIKKDKKAYGTSIYFVFIKSIKSVFAKKIKLSDLESLFNE